MISYEINRDTLALIPISETKTRIIEKEREFIVNSPALKIIENSCEYFGSSYLGRHEGTKKLIGITHKAPIIIEETNKLIYFPTSSPRLCNCSWIGLNHIKNYKSCNGKTVISFNNNEILDLDISFGSFDNQVLRATKLESVLRKRINPAD